MVKPIHWILLVLSVSIATWIILKTGRNDQRAEYTIDLNWRFTQEDKEEFTRVDFDDSDWDIVTLPHDWMIRNKPESDNPSGTAGAFYPGGTGWYRKHLDISDIKNKDQFYLVFDGVYMDCDVWVNEHHVDSQNYGYIGFNADISSYLNKDTINIIAVRTEATNLPVDRWYSGAGIYRNVRLIATRKLHFAHNGIHISNYTEDGIRVIKSDLEIINNSDKSRRFKVRSDLLDPDGKLIDSRLTAAFAERNKKVIIHDEHFIESPSFWSDTNPDIYEIRHFILQNKRVKDNTRTRFGVRDAIFDPDSGFILNGQKKLLKGVCLHHDGGALGSAVPISTWEYRLKQLKRLGVNAVRLAHNPHDPEILDLCDRMGFFVIDEMYDKWEMNWSGANSDFKFAETYMEDFRYFIRRDRNHPSVIAWSLGNETIEQLENPELGVQWYKKLNDLVLSIDTSRSITCGLHPGNAKSGHEIPSRYIQVTPLVSYNYRTDSLNAWHREFPTKIWLASETKPYTEGRPKDFGKVSYSDNSWNDMERHIAGQFIWAGIDYMGETMGWPDRNFRHGLLTTDGRIKPGAYYTQSIYSEKPVVKITVVDPILADSLNRLDSWQAPWFHAPLVRHWNFSKGDNKLSLVIFTNCSTVDIVLNGEKIDTKKKSDYQDGVIKTDIPFESGELRVLAYDNRQPGIVAKDSLITSKKPSKIRMTPDKPMLIADGRDVMHIETSITDDEGVVNPTADNMISYNIEGPARLKVIDNGNSADHTSYGSSEKRVYNGKHLLIIQSTTNPGDLIIEARTDGVPPAKLNIKSKKSEKSINNESFNNSVN